MTAAKAVPMTCKEMQEQRRQMAHRLRCVIFNEMLYLTLDRTAVIRQHVRLGELFQHRETTYLCIDF